MYKVIIQEENGKEIQSLDVKAVFATGIISEDKDGVRLAVMSAGEFKALSAINGLAESAAIHLHEISKEMDCFAEMAISKKFQKVFVDKHIDLMVKQPNYLGGGRTAHGSGVEIQIEIGGKRNE